MPTPDFIVQLREKIGQDQIFVPACSAIILRDVPADAALWEVPSVLLVTVSYTHLTLPTICSV